MAKLKGGSRIYGNVTIDTSVLAATVNASTVNAASFVLSNGVDLIALAQTGGSTSNDAYAQANTARGTANDAYGQANNAYNTSNNAYVQANAAYAQANTVYGQANDAYSQANAAYGAANNAKVTVFANSGAANVTTQVINFVNTASILVSVANTTGNANIAFDIQGTPYDTANGAYAQANSARNQANGAYGQANAAYGQANAAYGEANLKLNLTGGSLTGSLNVEGDLKVTNGNIYLSGNTTFINVTTYQVDDPLLYIAANNELTDTVDIGFIGGKNTSGTYSHTGLARHAADGKWYLFDNLADEGHIDNIIDVANTTYAILRANIEGQSINVGSVPVANTNHANSAYNQANAAYGQANLVYGQANAAYAQANLNYLPAVTRLDVTNNGASAYRFDQYGSTTDDPTLYIRAGETLAFNLNNAGHPFAIRVSNGGSNYDTGLTHVSTDGTVSTGSAAQGKTSGTLYWKVPSTLGGNTYVYQCTIHSGMVGNIVIEPSIIIAYGQANAAYSQANTARTTANDAYGAANTAGTNALNAYGQANAAYSQANTARDTANSAYGQANTARTTANDAYNAANTAQSTAQNAYGQANTARSDANTTFGTTNTTFATINSTFATLNTADSNRVLKAGDTMTGNLIVSGATINTATANITTIITGNNLTLATGTGSNGSIIFSANNTEDARIVGSSGNMGIGTTNPQGKLTISNAGAEGIEFFTTGGVGGGSYFNAYNRTTGLYVPFTYYANTHTFYTNAGATRVLDMTVSGDIGIGIASPTSNFHVVGNANITSTITTAANINAGNVYTAGNVSGVLKSTKDFILANTAVNSANTIDLSVSNYFRCVLTASAQFTFTNAPTSGTGQLFSILMIQNATGGYTPSWANTIYWAGGTAPPATTAANARDLWTFITYDGGTTYWGTLTIKDAR